MTDKIITQEYLQTIFEYKDGELYWNVKRSGIQKGDMAGCIDTKGYKNVAWIKSEKRWKVKINSNNKSYYLGMYKDLELAILVAEMAREKYHKEFAVHN